VQSISEWAPVCIGPYAQANTLEGVLIYVAGECSESLKFAYSLAIGYQFRSIIIGQIPLDPASMQIIRGIEDLTSLLLCQLWLSLRHALRVISALNAKKSVTSRVLCCTVYVNLESTAGNGSW